MAAIKAILAEQPRLEEPRLTEKLERFLLTRQETPFLAVDTNVVEEKYVQLRHYFPSASIYYAVKANPAPQLVERKEARSCGWRGSLSSLRESSCFANSSFREVGISL